MFDEPSQRPRTSATPGAAPMHSVSETQLFSTNQALAGLRKLYEFSEKLMTMKELDQLLEAMLDAVIEVTGAEKGLILLMDDAFGGDSRDASVASANASGASPPSPETAGEAGLPPASTASSS